MFHLRIIGDLGFEVWQDIPGYEGYYQVSTYGMVRSVDRYVGGKSDSKKFVNGKVLVQSIGTRGYYFVGLHKGSKLKTGWIHKVVAAAFIPNPQKYPCVNHRDEDKSNNRVENLEWCTIGYNNRYGTRIQRVADKERNSPIRSKKILQFDLNGEKIREFPSTKEVTRITGFSNGNICNCCNGRQKTAYGYIWKYSEYFLYI